MKVIKELRDVFISDDNIEKLQLLIRNPRNVRRQIAKDAKIKWEVYKILEREVMIRKKTNLNLNTGKEINE